METLIVTNFVLDGRGNEVFWRVSYPDGDWEELDETEAERVRASSLLCTDGLGETIPSLTTDVKIAKSKARDLLLVLLK